jgi:hypothetical protein
MVQINFCTACIVFLENGDWTSLSQSGIAERMKWGCIAVYPAIPGRADGHEDGADQLELDIGKHDSNCNFLNGRREGVEERSLTRPCADLARGIPVQNDAS